MTSLPSLELLPPTTVWGLVDPTRLIWSTPSPPKITIEPLLKPWFMMLSFSVPPFTVPVLPVCSRMVSLPESPVMVARPVPWKMQSSPARPTMVPGPVSLP